jgi:hypothetical protein
VASKKSSTESKNSHNAGFWRFRAHFVTHLLAQQRAEGQVFRQEGDQDAFRCCGDRRVQKKE